MAVKARVFGMIVHVAVLESRDTEDELRDENSAAEDGACDIESEHGVIIIQSKYQLSPWLALAWLLKPPLHSFTGAVTALTRLPRIESTVRASCSTRMVNSTPSSVPTVHPPTVRPDSSLNQTRETAREA